MADIVISVEHLSKQYHLGVISHKTLSHDLQSWWARIRGNDDPNSKIVHSMAIGHNRTKEDFIHALSEVSFDVQQGEVLGIIGRNGAGKSTLLKILSRVTAPTSGRIKVQGRIASLLEVGTGFHPELTGSENIYLNGAILGMSKNEVTRKFDEIVDFSGVGQFITTPVKRYSSGMYVRLAFAVAAHLDSEILIVDEVLAVGDAEFQKKCLGKMGDVAKDGRTVLFVSHNMAAIKRLCDSTALIDKGRLSQLSSTSEVIDSYLSSGYNESSEFRAESISGAPGKGGVKLLRVTVMDAEKRVSDKIRSNSPFFVEIEYFMERIIEDLRVGYRLISLDGGVVFTSGDTDPDGAGTSRMPGKHISRCIIPKNILNSGKYYITATCDRPMQEVHFIEENIVSFTVVLISGVGASIPDGRYGTVRLDLDWQRDRIDS